MSFSFYIDAISDCFGSCLGGLGGSSQVKINGRNLKILRLLGEGGFSYVYLVEDPTNGQYYALKKIRCPFGQESVSQALKEVEAYSLFAPHPNIIHSVDHSVVSDRSDAGAKTVYILLPYYRQGNLQDVINANLVNGTRYSERRAMIMLLGVCKALKAMHQYKVKGSSSIKKAKGVRAQAVRADREAAEEVESRRNRRDQSDVEQEPLMDDEVTASRDGVAPGQIRAYAHRDLKPANIMLDDDGTTPILMDLGSLAPSPTQITSRSQAIAVQDEAGEHSTLPYRAPELFEVQTGKTIDTKVDIWSLGCTVYALLIGKSPFEARSDESGGSLNMCILNADWRWPDEASGKGSRGQQAQSSNSISEGVKEVVSRCLSVEPDERPDVDQLISLVKKAIAALPEED